MPAQIVLVHDDAAFTGMVGRALAESGYEVMAVPDPLVALKTLETAKRVELLITRVSFPAGRSNGMALALMAKQKQPGVKVLFVCSPEFRNDVADLGEVLLVPVGASELVETAARIMRDLSAQAVVGGAR